MPKLSPLVEEKVESAKVLAACNEILAENPVTQHLAHSEDEIRTIMEELGIGLRGTLNSLANLMRSSSEGTRLNAVKLSLDALGVTGKRDSEANVKGVTINIVSSGDTQVNQQSIFNPQRT
jgi:hypothetical protein